MVKVNKTNYSNHCESIRTITFVWSYLTQSVTVSCRWFFVFGKLHQWGLLCLPSWRVIFERHPVLQSERTIENWSDSTAACNRLCHGYILHTTESLSWRPLNVVDSCKQTSKRFAETFVIQTFMASCRLELHVAQSRGCWGTDENALYEEKTHIAFSSALQNSHDFFYGTTHSFKREGWKMEDRQRDVEQKVK